MANIILFNNRLVDMDNAAYVPPSTTTLNDGLVAVYKGESNANDSLGLYNGTAVGGLVYTTGKSGNAFLFNGTNAYVNLPDNSFQFVGDFAISVWVYPTSGLPQNIINNLGYTNGSVYKGWQLDINNLSGGQSYKVTFAIGQGPSGSNYTGWEFTTTAMTPNTWNHIFIQRVGGVNTYGWVNNVSQSYTLRGTGANITTNPVYHTTQYVTIGASKTLAGVAANYMKANSMIDELVMWNRTLTTTERNDLYNSGAGKFYLFT